MKQRYKLYSLLIAATLFTTGCSDDNSLSSEENDSNKKEAIDICSGIDTGMSGVATRAIENKEDGYYAFQTGTQISLITEGTWTGHTPATIVKTSKAKAGAPQNVAASGAEKEKIYNNLSIADTDSPLFWDDFGTADPANKETGRVDGLTMYATAVDGLTTAGPLLTASTDAATGTTTISPIEWDVTTTQETNGWSNVDLLISNNIQSPTNGKEGAADGRYKFINRKSAANLIFKHAMSKITINLYRGTGFTAEEMNTGLTTSVTLLQMATKGHVNITNGAVTELGTVADFKPHQDEYKTGNDAVPVNALYATYSALVMPGNTFDDTKDILKINVNGNDYVIKGDKIIDKAETDETKTSHTLLASNNYEFNIIVSKTGLTLIAQIIDWNKVKAESVEPIIITADDRTSSDYNASIPELKTGFKLWYAKTSATKGYLDCKDLGNQDVPVTVTYDKDATGNKFVYTPLYWPDHINGYHFRGALTYDEVSKVVAKDASGNEVYPVLKNGKDDGDYFELTSGIEDTHNVVIGTHQNDVDGNKGTGAMATSGKVILTFSHKMAHVTVHLKTTENSDAINYVNLGSATNCDKDMAEVVLLDYYPNGIARIGSGAVETKGEMSNWSLPNMTTTYNADRDDNFYKRASYVVPQDLTADSKCMKFQVKIKDKDGKVVATYETKALSEFDVTVNGTTGTKKIGKWEPGYKYEYILTLSRTDIAVTAVVTDWLNGGTGSVDVPFIQ